MNKKLKNFIIPLAITLSVCTMSGEYDKVLAMPVTSVSQTEIDKDNSMTLDQLKVVAKPMPQDAIRTETDKFGTSNHLKFDSLLPEDGNIYYIESTWNDGTHFQTFYKFLYVTYEEQNTVGYHVYTWDYVNDKLDHQGQYQANLGNEQLYNELVNANKSSNASNSTSTQTNQIPSDPPTQVGESQIASTNSSSDNSNGNSNASISKKYTKKRFGGESRIETSALIANEYNSGIVQSVVIANGYGFADALSGSVLAKKLNAPILLTGANLDDSSATIDYIEKHLDKNGTIYILGGEGSVSVDFINKLNLLGFSNIKRLYGQDRYSTNGAINNNLNVAKGTPIVIANGEGFADALSISSIASRKGYPVVLSQSNILSNQAIDTIKNIQPSQIFVVGGIGSITDDVKEQIKSLTGLSDDKVTRISGNTRYETSLNIAKYFNLDTDTAVFANGEGFADALSGSVLAAKHNAPIILLNEDITSQKTYLDSTKYTNEILLGGTGSISNSLEDVLSK